MVLAKRLVLVAAVKEPLKVAKLVTTARDREKLNALPVMALERSKINMKLTGLLIIIWVAIINVIEASNLCIRRII